jgi:quercetin dioxygenase-like cupin family protein
MGIVKGNFNIESPAHRGWIMGHFMEDESPFKTENVEIKWGIHKAGEKKEVVAQNCTAHSLGILIRGKFTFLFDNQKVTLDKEGDYAFYSSGTAHSWTVEQDCLFLTIRWPSVSNDQKPAQ